MTEEQLRIANNTFDALREAKSQFEDLHRIVHDGRFIKVSSINENYITALKEDEVSFLIDLLEYRRKEMIALEKEFANL